MGVELCSDNSIMGVSPRISFSYDLCQSDVAAVEQQHHHHPLRSNSSSSSSRSMNSSMEFDFCVVVRESFEQESSSADELFSDGKMIPSEIKKKSAQPKQVDQISMPHQHPPLPTAAAADPHDENTTRAKESARESKNRSSNEADEKQSSKSFWGFKRSSSCGSGYGRSLCPLPLLSRSNSTGSSSSSSSVKRSLFSKEGQNQKQTSQQKSASKKLHSSSQSSSTSMNYQKPPLKKGQYGSYGNVAPFNPVLNVPTANLFGFGLIFSNGKDKTNRKK